MAVDRHIADIASELADVIYVMRTEPDIAFEFVSRSVETLVGYTPQEHYDDPDLGMRIIDPRDLDVLADAVKAEEGRPVDFTVRWLAKDGRTVWTHHHCRRVSRDDGSVAVYGAARDVTGHQEALAALERSEARLKLLLANCADVVVQGDKDGVLRWLSPSLAEVLGWRAEQWVGRGLTAFVHPFDLSELEQAQATLLAGGPARLRVRLRTATASYRWMDVTMTPDFGPGSEVVGQSGAWRDVHDEVLARTALAEREAQLQEVTGYVSDVILQYAPDGTVRWASPSLRTAFGYDPQEVIGTPFRLGVPEGRAAVSRAVREAAASGQDAVTTRLEARAADGSRRWVDASTRFARTPDGGIEHSVTVMHDVTTLVEAEARRAAVLDSMLDPHVLLSAVRDDEGRIVDFIYSDANAAACQYMRTSVDQLLGSTLLDLLPGQAGTGMLDLYARAVDSGEPLLLDDYSYPHEILQDERRYDIRAIKVDEALSFTWRDVTDRYDAAQLLSQSEHDYRMLAENASDVVFRADASAVLEWVSPSVTQALGWDPDLVVGRPATDFLHPDDLQRLRSAARSPLQGHHGREEVRLRTPRDTFVWMAVTGRTVREGDGVAVAFVGSAHNIETEREADRVLRFLATHDPLTRLANRPALVTRMGRILSHPPRTGTRLAVLFLDLDGLKDVNDTLGHAVGDQVIVEVAERIADQVRSDDIIARFGGDEFIVALPSIHAAEEAETIAAKIHGAVRAPIHTGAGDVAVTVSVGIAIADPGDDPDEVLRHADQAMYRAKNTGPDRTSLYDPTIDAQPHRPRVTR